MSRPAYVIVRANFPTVLRYSRRQLLATFWDGLTY